MIQYCIHCGLTAIQMVHEMPSAYQNECWDKRMIMWLHKAFVGGHELTEKLNSSGWSPTSATEQNVNTVATNIREKTHLFKHDLTAQINIPKTIVHHISTECCFS